MVAKFRRLALLLATGSTLTSATLNIASAPQIKQSASSIATNLMSYYDSNLHTLYPSDQWYDWITAAGYASLVTYYHTTGDTKYNSIVTTGLQSRLNGSSGGSEGKDFMGPLVPGNDDQLWWGLAAMATAEYGVPDADISPAQNVLEEVMSRWDTSICGGGLRWQISESSGGADRYAYKNSVTNGLAFQLAARLARYTGDAKYVGIANDVWTWSVQRGLVDGDTYAVADGLHTEQGCAGAALQDTKWTYNVGVYLYGAAVMLEHTGDAGTWRPHVDGLIAAAKRDFTTSDDVMKETTCEGTAQGCNQDQTSFKSHLVRALAISGVLVPETKEEVNSILIASATAAVGSCDANSACGMQWTVGKFDGVTGPGEQMNALEIVQAGLAAQDGLPATQSKEKLAKRWVA